MNVPDDNDDGGVWESDPMLSWIYALLCLGIGLFAAYVSGLL